MEPKKVKVYIYRFTNTPELVEQYGGNITILEKNGEINPLFDQTVDVEDFDYVHISNFDNLDFIFDESFHGNLCYDFYSFRDDLLLDFKLAIAGILARKIDKRKKEIEELENLKGTLGNLVTQVVARCADNYNIDKVKQAFENKE